MMSRSQSLTQRPWYSGVSAVNVPSGATEQISCGPFAVDESRLLGLQHVEVDFAEGRGLMDDARAGVDGDEIGRHDAPGDVLLAAVLQSALRLALACCSSNRNGGTIAQADELARRAASLRP